MTASPFPKVSVMAIEGPLSKSSLYEMAQEHPGLIKKVGGVAVVDRDLYYKILAGSPPAKLGYPRPGHPRSEKSRK